MEEPGEKDGTKKGGGLGTEAWQCVSVLFGVGL